MAYDVLIVDDSKTVRSILVKTLKLIGQEINHIFEASNGREALDCLQHNWIDLVLSDLNMPVMNGMEMVKAMASDGILKDIPVIIITTDGSSVHIDELKKRGIREYIQKPFTPENVGEVISRIMGVAYER